MPPDSHALNIVTGHANACCQIELADGYVGYPTYAHFWLLCIPLLWKPGIVNVRDHCTGMSVVDVRLYV